MADGYLNKCKSCVKSRVSTHREDNLDRIQEYDRNRSNKEERTEKDKIRREEIKLNDPDKYKVQYLDPKVKYSQENEDKRKAVHAVSNALRDKRLIKSECCSRCVETENIQGHHWSYKEEHWLDVIWLCVKCHAEEHVKLREESRGIPF